MTDEIDIPVEEHTQKTEWSCGPAALKILMSYYQDDISEDELIKLTGANETEGTRHEGLIRAAQELGYRVTAHDNTQDDVFVRFLGSGLPVMVDYQGSNGGHYVVITGLSDGRVHIEDPRRHGSQHHTLEWNVFKARWYNITYGDRKFINKWMMVIER